jgi:2-amino-4-hydroxy-6-hydroxymethyldihydropteridine diphosphokinase
VKRRALLLLGANLGDRARTLKAAVRELGRLDGTRLVKVSRLYETAPVGPSEKPYLNLAVALDTERTAMGLLIEAKRLEAAAGRRPGVKWGARVLDVDVIALGSERRSCAWLTVPHPLVARRAFALGPLREVSGAWKPDGKRTASALYAAMNPPPGICKIAHGR